MLNDLLTKPRTGLNIKTMVCSPHGDFAMHFV